MVSSSLFLFFIISMFAFGFKLMVYIYIGHCYTTTSATRDGVCLDQNTNPHFFFACALY